MGTKLAKLTALSDTVQRAILEHLKQGNYIGTACQASGITYRGFRGWQKRWEEGDPAADRFALFFEAVPIAIAAGEAYALADLRRGAPGWQAQAWFLERRFPSRWAKKDQLIIKGKDVAKLSDEELESIAAGKG